MFYPKYGSLTVDQWRQDMESYGAAEPDVLVTRAFDVARKHFVSNPDEFNLLAAAAGVSAVFAVNTLAASAVLIDGPLPFGDYIGLALWMIPDATIYGTVYGWVD
jgi:hypothetical protein